MSLRYRVGLDVGTASMGLVAVSLDDSGVPLDIIHHDLRIWNEPLAPKTGILLNQDRRAKRLHRRQIRRRARRMRGIAHLAPLLGLDASSILHSNEQSKNGERVLELRARAVNERVELEDLLRVMLLLSKKRGYKGTFKEPRAKKLAEETTNSVEANSEAVVPSDEADADRAKETKQVKDGIGRLSEELERRGGITVGQYIHQEHLADPTKNLKFGKDHSGFYASRAMIEDEFDRIWEKQREYHSVILDTEHPVFGALLEDGSLDLSPRPLKEHFSRAVLFQRPVVWDAGTIGRCLLEPGLPRSPMAQPSAQSFRIEKNIADLRWRGAGKEERLTQEQNAVIRELLYNPEELDAHGVVSFARMYEKLDEQAIRGIGSDGNAQTFTKDRSTKGHTEGSSRLNGLIGERTRKAFEELGVLNEWLALNPDTEAPDSRTQIQVINFLSGLTSVEEVGGADTDWASRFEPTIRFGKRKNTKRTIDPKVVDFINKIHATGKLGLLAKMGFDTSRSAYSIRANRILANYMKEHATDETDAKCRAYRKCTHSETNALCPQSVDLSEGSVAPVALERPASTGNQIVDISLEQIYRAMQELIGKYGMPAEMHIELARDMKLSAKGRREMEREQRDKAKGRELIFSEIRDRGGAPTGKNIDKYLLARDMGHKCPYCRRCLSIEDVLSESATEFEHILPRSRSGVGKKNVFHSLLACKSCNSKKDNHLAWDAFPNDRENLKRSAEELSPGILDKIEAESGISTRKKVSKKSKSLRGPRARDRIMENKARWLLQQSFEEVQDSESSIDSVAASAANDTSWIAKIACEWLQSITESPVFPTRGRITSVTRRRWGLETVIPEARIRDGLPVFTTRALENISSPIEIEKGQEIGILLKDKFEEFKKYWEGHSPQHELGPDVWIPPLDKRRDHRHHLIDALTIALTTRSHAQRLSLGRKRNSDVLVSDRHRGFDLAEWQQQYSPGLQRHRDKALKMIENAAIRRKTDRYVAGPLLEETAYAKRDTVIASRSKLAMLKESDLEKIVEPETRTAVIAQVNAYKSGAIGGRALSYAQAIAQPIYHRFIEGDGRGTLVKSVLVARTDIAADSPSLIEVKSVKNAEKPFVYKSGGNAYLEIDEQGNSKVVRLLDSYGRNHSSHGISNHAPRRIFINDLVREMVDGQVSGPTYVVKSMTGGLDSPTLLLVLASETLTYGAAKAIAKDLKEVGILKPLAIKTSGKNIKKWAVIDP
ncbi:MAG TPA: HNH endonuclease domain-containing protein [Candidatus Nanopelagicaceae bacterium]|nr:HNH endonuclease domain-containing protein [Candidatus Nanopelagicaceae bacterium]